jgi:hypothetical protein
MGAVVWTPVLYCRCGKSLAVHMLSATAGLVTAYLNGLCTMAAASLHEPLRENQCRVLPAGKIGELFRADQPHVFDMASFSPGKSKMR